MVNQVIRLQFRIRDLMICAAIVSVVLGLIVNEPVEIAFAALFCAFSCWCIATLLMISCMDLFSKIGFSFAHRTFRPLSGRIKWLIIDVTILIWTIAIISVSNYIHSHSVHRAQWLVAVGALTGPGFAWWLSTKTRRVISQR